jgi:hypothetical protein
MYFRKISPERKCGFILCFNLIQFRITKEETEPQNEYGEVRKWVTNEI